VFRNVGIQQSDAGEIPKRIHTRFKTRRKFEIKVTVRSLNHKKHIHGFNADHVEVMYVSLKNWEWLQLQVKNQLVPRG